MTRRGCGRSPRPQACTALTVVCSTPCSFPAGTGSCGIGQRLGDDLPGRALRRPDGKLVAMVCHAPGILRDAKAPNGEPLAKKGDV